MDVRRCWDVMFKTTILRDYPKLAESADAIKRRVLHYCHWPSFITCGGMMVDFLPCVDLLISSILAIDTNEWRNDALNSFGEAYQNFKVLSAMEQSIRESRVVSLAD